MKEVRRQGVARTFARHRFGLPVPIGIAIGLQLLSCAKLLGIDAPVDAPPDAARADASAEGNGSDEAQVMETGADGPVGADQDGPIGVDAAFGDEVSDTADAAFGGEGLDTTEGGDESPGDDTGADADADAGPPPSILYVGDSIAAETRNSVQWWMGASRNVTFNALVAPAAAICDFLEGQPGVKATDTIRARVQADVPAIVLFQFWGDASTQCLTKAIDGGAIGSTAYFQQYQADALNAVQEVEDGARAAGIPRPKILWVLQGPDAESQTRTKQLNSIYEYVASLSSDRTSDAGFPVSMAADPYGSDAQDPRYTWTEYLPCTDFERMTNSCSAPQSFGGTTQLHKDTDKVHFCLGDESTFDLLVNCAGVTQSPGVNRYAMQIAGDATAWLAN